MQIECKLNANDFSSPKTCNLSGEQLKSINFENKESGEVNINGSTVAVEISKGEEDFYPGGYRFTFKTTKGVTGPVSLKKNTNTEFKIKRKEDGTWSLERAWDIHKLAGKIGLKDCAYESGGTTGKCSFAEDKKINYYENDGSFTVQGTMTLETEQKISFEENKENCNQGFCFKIEKDISVSQVTPAGITAGPPVPAISKNHTYQIEKKDFKNNQKYWFLVGKAS